MPRENPPPTVEQFAHTLSARVLHCRELGHTWRPNTVTWDGDARAFDRRLRCSSCRTVRVQIVGERGGVISNRYIYPEGYLAKGINNVSANRDLFRLEALTRFLEGSHPKAVREVA